MSVFLMFVFTSALPWFQYAVGTEPRSRCDFIGRWEDRRLSRILHSRSILHDLAVL